MARQDVKKGIFPGMQPRPDTPLTDYAPGALAHLSPEERGQALKKSKRATPGAALSIPKSVLT
jgi:hypothetical protein